MVINLKQSLDLGDVRAFVLTADLSSFTRAADQLQMTQAAISMKVRRLESLLERRLLERTPRRVHLSADGAAFLTAARELLEVHDRVLGFDAVESRRIAVGISQHLIGAKLPEMLTALRRHDASLAVEIRVAGSAELRRQVDAGELDATITVQESHFKSGKVIYSEKFLWMGVPHWKPDASQPLPISTQGKTCALRNAAVAALDRASIRWNEVFIGQGAACVGAAASAGLAVALLAERAAPVGTVDLTRTLNLPSIATRKIALYSTLRDRRSRNALDIVAAALELRRT